MKIVLQHIAGLLLGGLIGLFSTHYLVRLSQAAGQAGVTGKILSLGFSCVIASANFDSPYAAVSAFGIGTLVGSVAVALVMTERA